MLKSLSNTSFSVEEDPEWLDSLKGGVPLLGESKLKFISQVRSEIKQGPALDEWTPQATGSRSFDIRDLKRNFMELIEHLRMKSQETLFLQTYPEWKIYRADTVAKLSKIADLIDKDEEFCETATTIMSGMSLVGGLMSQFSDEKLQIAGSVMMGAGNFTTAVTSVIGSVSLGENIREANEAIEKDKEHMANLWKWVQDTEHFQNTMKSIESIDIDGSLQATARRLHSVSKMKLNSIDAQSKVKEVVGSFKCPQELKGDISDVMGILISFYMLYERYRPFIERILKVVDSGSRLLLSSKLIVSSVGLYKTLSASQAVELSSNQRALIIGGMCLDVASIVRTYMEKNSESMESRKIRRAIEMMRDEGDFFRDLYDELRGGNHAEP